MRLRALAAALAIFAAGCSGTAIGDAADSPADVRILPRGKIGGVLFGGLSGLAWDPTEKALLAISDRGQAFLLPFAADQPVARVGRIDRPRGGYDPEALRRTPEGGWLVAFEHGALIADYPGPAHSLTRPPRATRSLAKQAGPDDVTGIEALALLDFGRLLAIAEGGAHTQRPAWLIDGPDVEARAYPIDDGFSPVDALALPNGDLLVLERRFNGIVPPFFSTRLARVPAALLDAPGRPLEPETRIDLAEILPSENWEGMEIAGRGADRALWLVSDDNQRWPFRTLLARLPLVWIVQATAAD